MGHDGFRPSLRVATCDYAGRSYGWEPLSGQSAAMRPAMSATIRDPCVEYEGCTCLDAAERP